MMRIENYFALKFIIKSAKNKEISTASIIVIIVIATSIIFFISAVSIMNGYIQGLMKISYEVKSSHIDYPVSYSYKNAELILENIKKNKNIKYAYLYKEKKILLSANSKNTGMVYFRAVPEDLFEKDEGLDSIIKIKDGKKSLKYNEIFISEKTAAKLKLTTNKNVYLTAMESGPNQEIILKRLKVSGIFTTGYVELDEQLAFIGEETGRKIFNIDEGYSISIKVDDINNVNEIIKKFHYSGYMGMLSWEELNYNELTALKFEKNVIAFIVILVIFVAALNILTTIFLTMNEKRENIGILKAIGYSKTKIKVIFLLNGIYLGFIGIITGIIFGLLIMNHLNEILNFVAWIFNFILNINYKLISIFMAIDKPEIFEIFSKEFYLDKIYTYISFREIIITSALTLFFSITASIIPALKAGELKPIEVINNG